MERRLILMDMKKRSALVAGATSGLGLATAEALSGQGPTVARLFCHPGSGQGLTDRTLRGMAEQVRLLSATVDSLLRRAD
jgi:NAD(P)-dependent dehydrogenase (short-subunit alcohol dehydrogenase family)